MMTPLEQVIREVVTRTTVTTISTTTDRIAEELTRELLKDPEVKADLLRLIRQAFAETVAQMRRDGASA